jgi:NodT family efflux transporter outer membrane factor (OMF) lipoprotein
VNPARAAALSALLMAAGCASMGDPGTRAVPTDASTLAASQSLAGSSPAVSPAAWPAREWWAQLGDPQLDRLVGEALAGSPSLRIAKARFDQAMASASSLDAARSVQATASLDSSRQRFSENFIYPPPFAGSWRWQNQMALNFSYELDFWGRNRAAYEAAIGQAKAAEAEGQAARLSLASAVVRAYLQLSQAHDQRDIAAATLAQREKLLDLSRARLSAGLDSRVELKQSETGIPSAREEMLRYDEQIALTRNQLAALAGKGPDAGLVIARPALRAGSGGAVLPSVLPADLLGRRPDVVAQRWRVEASARDIAAAKAQFYPNVNIVAFVGLQSLGFSNWLSSGSEIAGAGPAVRLPLFDGGRLRGNLAGRNAEFDLAVEQYNQTVVDALRDVVDQLTLLRSMAARQRESEAALGHAEESYALAVERYRGGLSSQLQVLAAESQVLAQRSLAADLRARALDASVGLIRALGGGYEPLPKS